MPSFKYVADVQAGMAVNSQRSLACNKPWQDSIQEYELANGPLSKYKSGTGHLPEAGIRSSTVAASPFAPLPGVLEDDPKLAGNRWHRGSPFMQKASDLPKHIIEKVPTIWLSAFIGMVDKTLPENQDQAMAAVVGQAGRSGSEEAKAFTSALLEARAYLSPKVLSPPTQKAADHGALGVSLEKLHAATKARNELREKARLSEVAYESEVKKGYDIRTSIEAAEELLRSLRLDLDASMAALVP